MFRRKEPEYMTQEFLDDALKMLANGATDAEIRRKWPQQMEYCDLLQQKAMQRESALKRGLYILTIVLDVIVAVLILIKTGLLRI